MKGKCEIINDDSLRGNDTGFRTMDDWYTKELDSNTKVTASGGFSMHEDVINKLLCPTEVITPNEHFFYLTKELEGMDKIK